MRIALISFEYAGVAQGGGIGTYVRNAAGILSARGHSVEVFTAGPRPASDIDAVHGFQIHTVPAEVHTFREQVTVPFAERHRAAPFDVIEGPEYAYDAAGVVSAFPELPLVVRLHAPRFTIEASNANYISALSRARFILGALRRGRIPRDPWRYDCSTDPECTHALKADEVVACSKATADRVASTWGLPRERLVVIPYGFEPSHELLSLSCETRSRSILFLGRLEVRKGVLDLAKAVPLVMRQEPDARFRFVGRALLHPDDGAPIDEHVRRIVGKHASKVEIDGSVPYSAIPAVLGKADICAFPSDWEASGFVCLEAMSAGCGVIGSSSGGMAELIDHGHTGLLVPPRNPRAIAQAIVTLLRDPERRTAMGRAARVHVLNAYSRDAIGPLQEASYARAIERAGARRVSRVARRSA